MKILSVDAETNGLQGQPFAVGAVCTDDADPGRAEAFIARCGVVGPMDPWVLANVMPALEDVPFDMTTRYVDLLGDFADWFDAHKDGATVIAHVGVPVEARLFRDMIWFLDRDPFSGPFPLHDLATLLLAAGCDPLSADGYRATRSLRLAPAYEEMSPHNPLYDAAVTAAVWRHLMEVGAWQGQ
jgi:hypothetical protein